MKHIWKIKGLLLPKRRKMRWNRKVHFSKITETAHWELLRKAAYSEHSIAIHSISMAGCVTAVLAFVRAALRGRKTSSSVIFWKVTSCDFTPFYSVLTQPNVCCCFYMCLVKTIAKLCPNMIHFDALDFSECRSEEVISFFWRSVYFHP